MLFRKTERKKHSACVILTIGALAAIGAVSIGRCGKQIINEAGNKIKGLFKKNDVMCSEDCCE